MRVIERMPRVSSRYWQRVWNYRAHYTAMICRVTCDNPTYNKLWEWRQAGEISIKKTETIGGWDGDEEPSGEIGLR